MRDKKGKWPHTDRDTIDLAVGEEIILKAGYRSFILRGTSTGVQVFGKSYLKSNGDKIAAGNINGLVVGTSFSLVYEKDCIADIKRVHI